ncbi:MAG: prolyl oligopeptidase family serine peptidase [Candidatus Glassbacteria bacterium]|nr:prolyl oligopeptidase family serine peptidase [Candidatus Glassbacteria bacterium]
MQVTPFLRYQVEMAWRQDERRQAELAAVRTETEFLEYQRDLRGRLLEIIGGLPEEKTPLRPRITGTIEMDGYRIEKLVFESLPGFHVTAAVYVPAGFQGKRPAVIVTCGHSPVAKAFRNYQEISARLVQRGYLVICLDPVGQGERSQYWDKTKNDSRYNRVCGEHGIFGNVAYLAGSSLARHEAWDCIRAFDYLATRPEVDPERIAITGTSGGGVQSALAMALEPRIFAGLPSCYISSLPMRMANRIFRDPDSDPEQDVHRIVSSGVGHPGLCLLTYPRPLVLSVAVEDFFPIEGARKTWREVEAAYRRFGHADKVAISEGYHPHSFSDHNQLFAFGFLDRQNGLPERHGFEPFKLLDVEELNATKSGQVRVEYPDGKHFLELVRDYYHKRKDSRSIGIRDIYHGRNYPGIARWTVVPWRYGKSLQEIGWEAAGSAEHNGYTIDRYVLHHSGLLSIPVLHVKSNAGSAGSRAILWLGHRRKLGEDNFNQVEQLLEQGYDVISFDFRGQGENMMRYAVASIDDPRLAAVALKEQYYSQLSGVMANYVYNTLLTGRPYFLQMVEDVEIVSKFASEKLGLPALDISGREYAHTLAAAAAGSIDGLGLVNSPDGKLVDWAGIVERMQETWPIEYLLPDGAYVDLN